MTVLVGIACSDGVVIGCDSAELAGRAGHYTIERQEGVFKIELIGSDVITAYTGATGLSQRFNDQVTSSIKLLKQKFVRTAPVPGIGYVGTPLERFLSLNVQPGQVPYDVLNPVGIGRAIAQAVIGDFQGTQSTYQNANGWGLGALFAFVKEDKPQLIEFDHVQFHPQLKGQPDPERADKDRNWRAVSMGAGKQLADAFLAHSYRLLFGDKVPTIERAKLVIVWTINHVCRYNPGWVGGATHLAVLKQVDGIWRVQHENVEETQEQMVALEEHITSFRVTPDDAAKTAIDLDKELDLPKDEPGK
jgi:20S proteasome alpha/beta subunit